MPPDDSPLKRLKKADLHRDRFPVIHALVAFVADGEHPRQAVQEQIEGRGRSRWYTTEGGHLVKMPYQGDPVPMEHFRVEPGGWDHEHCDGCGNRIEQGEQCWITDDADFEMLCNVCYKKLK